MPELAGALTTAEARRREAETSDLKSRRLLYCTDVKLGNQAIDAGDTQRAIELLKGHTSKNSQEDLREFAWHYVAHATPIWRRLPGTRGMCIPSTFSPDGKQLAGGRDGTIRLWDIATRHQTATLLGDQGEINIVSFLPHDASLVSCGDDGTIVVWDATKEHIVQRINGTMVAFRVRQYPPMATCWRQVARE